MTRRRFSAIVSSLCLSAAVLFARPLASQPPPSPILILVSIDGFRWDYLDRDRASLLNLTALAARGVRSEGLIPSFPTVTFPNHYTIVTGLVPDHHGIVANSMVDPRIGPEKFTMSSATAKDSRWWGGEPIWQTAMKQGRKAAAIFWPGSEAVKPTHWRPYDDKVTAADRVTQMLEPLRQPDPDRPVFNTLYMSDVDHAGHDFGPDSPEVRAALARVDAALGQLFRGVDALGLSSRTTYVVLSDHGMAATSEDRVIYLDDYLEADAIEVVDWTPNVAINTTGRLSPDEIYRRLANRHPALAVYRRDQLPSWLQYGTHARIPAVVGIAELGWTVTTHAALETRLASGKKFVRGEHGYDPRYREVHGLFVAAGPRLRKGLVVPEFQNIHIYNLMCELLGLSPAWNDGDFTQVQRFLAN